MEELILKHQQTKDEIIKLINNSGLPAFILIYIIEDLLKQLKQIEEQEYKKVLENKEKENKEEKTNE